MILDDGGDATLLIHLGARAEQGDVKFLETASNDEEEVLYAASKAFVATFTRALAKEVAAEGIRVNAVSPSVIASPMQERTTSPEAQEAARKMIPMGRIGGADECVGAFLYLSSNALSGYVTGQILEVNGGLVMP